jgi:hypothetical protein
MIITLVFEKNAIIFAENGKNSRKNDHNRCHWIEMNAPKSFKTLVYFFGGHGLN